MSISSKSNGVTKFNDLKRGFYLNEITVFGGVFCTIDHHEYCLAQNANRKYRRLGCTCIFVKIAFDVAEWFVWVIPIFFLMSSNRQNVNKLTIEENVRFQRIFFFKKCGPWKRGAYLKFLTVLYNDNQFFYLIIYIPNYTVFARWLLQYYRAMLTLMFKMKLTYIKNSCSFLTMWLDLFVCCKWNTNRYMYIHWPGNCHNYILASTQEILLLVYR